MPRYVALFARMSLSGFRLLSKLKEFMKERKLLTMKTSSVRRRARSTILLPA